MTPEQEDKLHAAWETANKRLIERVRQNTDFSQLGLRERFWCDVFLHKRDFEKSDSETIADETVCEFDKRFKA